MSFVKWFVVIGVIYFGYQYFYKNSNKETSIQLSALSQNIIPSKSTPSKTQNFTCDGRQHCSQMHSYDEAVFFLKHCPNVKMDGDGDGIPCEQQFGQ